MEFLVCEKSDLTAQPRVHSSFSELDRGTMTIVPSERVRESEAFPYRATILRKLYAYADNYRLQQHERFGIKALRTLFLTTGYTRADTMRAAYKKYVETPMRLPAGLILFQTSVDDILIAKD